MVFAVPYETVADANNLPNVALIPPGDLLFAQARVEVSWTFSGLSLRWITVFQDLNFPDPGATFTPLTYAAQSQSFAVGNIFTLSSEIGEGMSLTVQICLGAEPGSFSVKKYSTYGKADPEEISLTISLSNIPFPCPWCMAPFSDFRMGLSARIQRHDEPFISVTGSASLKVFKTWTISTSFTLGITMGLSWGGFSVSVPTSLGTLNLQLDCSGGLSPQAST